MYLKNKDLIKRLKRGCGMRCAEALGITPQYLSLLLHEKKKNPRLIEKAQAFADELERVTEEFKNTK